jgi:hypothetical protein
VNSTGLDRRVGLAVEFLLYFVAGARNGVLVIGADLPERFRRGFDLARPDAVIEAANFAVALGLRVALSLYRPDARSFDDSALLRTHTGAIRFPAGVEPADLLELTPTPNAVIWMGDDCESFALWGLVDPVEGDDIAGMLERERGLIGGDPSWNASPSSLIPIPGAFYTVDGVEREATEWPVAA